MTEVVVNRCYGGFGLSDKGMERYAELKGVTLYPAKDDHGFVIYWTVPEGQRPEIKWRTASEEERIAYNKAIKESNIYDMDIPRDDKILIQVVRELGDKANGTHANLTIRDVPDGVSWGIDEYDGQEWIAETHRTW